MSEVSQKKEAFFAQYPPGFGTLLLGLWICNLFAPFLVSGVTAILPSMGADLQARAVHLSLVMVVYALGQVIFSTIGGRFGSLWGLRRILLASVCVFTVVSVSTGFVPDVDTLLALRFLQGACAATISSCCTAIGMRMAPPARRGQVIGIMTSAVYLGLTLGPLIGGGVATVVGWRWLFFGILPPGAAVWWILRRNIRQEWTDAAGEKLDVPGALLLSFGLGCIAFGGGCYGVAPAMLWLLLPGALCMAVFFWWQWRASSPIVDMRMFRESPGLLTGLLAMFVNYGSTMGMVFFLSLYLQDVRGFTPFYAALVDRITNGENAKAEEKKSEKVIKTYVIPTGSPADGKTISQLDWGKHSVIVSVERGETPITPKGDTLLQAGDVLVFMISQRRFAQSCKKIETMISETNKIQ